ncbi:MAG: ATP-dependent zinc metalloprotease FtsH [Cytophagales bacterium]|nr:ATP-dependent zinc metalloprotease FtsH [Cytophagales bacterium]
MKIPKHFHTWLTVAGVLLFIGILYMMNSSTTVEITMTRFERMMEKRHVASVVVIRNEKVVELSLTSEALSLSEYKTELNNRTPLFSNAQGPHYRITITAPEAFESRFRSIQEDWPPHDKLEYRVEERSNFFSMLFNYGIFFVFLLGFWFLLRRLTGNISGGQLFNIGKSRATIFDRENKVVITFADVAGLDEAKEEVEEIVAFLKDPKKFTRLGGKIPKGALLVGPPGTGKTLLAKAVAGEAAVPFFSLSGSDFVEMFVGVGAARVRDLFKQAKAKAPCIVFIDEIDAVGRSRGKSFSPGSNDERENTLNSLLVEMDGFSTNSGVIILAATNRPDVLDHALLRPGRFDRQITIDKPDIKGREAIFSTHLRNILVDQHLDIRKLAAQTQGFAGAEIANVCNEAALIAARGDKKRVSMQDFQDAIDRVIGGLERRSRIISMEERKIVAYHEAGHAVVGWFLEHANPLVKISIVPRGTAALGYAQYLPKEQFLYQTQQLLDEMCMSLGGRAAEELVFDTVSTGALSDLERVTKMAFSMVAIHGMNKRIGHVSFHTSQANDQFNFQKPYSEATAKIIDEEVKDLVEKTYQRALSLLRKKRTKLNILSEELLKREIIYAHDLKNLIGKRPFPNPPEEQDEKKVKDPQSIKKSKRKSSPPRASQPIPSPKKKASNKKEIPFKKLSKSEKKKNRPTEKDIK